MDTINKNFLSPNETMRFDPNEVYGMEVTRYHNTNDYFFYLSENPSDPAGCAACAMDFEEFCEGHNMTPKFDLAHNLAFLLRTHGRGNLWATENL